MPALHLWRIDLVQPVACRDGRCHVKVESLQGIVHVGVFVHAPIEPVYIVVHQLHAVGEELVGLACLRALLAVQDVRLGDPHLACLDQHLLDDVLDLLHCWRLRAARETLFEDPRDLRRHGFGPAILLVAAHGLGGFENGICNASSVKGHDASVSLAYLRNGTQFRPPLSDPMGVDPGCVVSGPRRSSASMCSRCRPFCLHLAPSNVSALPLLRSARPHPQSAGTPKRNAHRRPRPAL